jgi:amino acid adenylation domain-containing protein
LNPVVTSHASRTLSRGFLESADRYPRRPALEIGAETLTYAQLRHEAALIAGAIVDAGIGDPPLCAVFAHRSKTAFAGVLGALLSGRGYVPLNRTFPPERTALMLTRSGARAMVVDDESARQLPEVLAAVDYEMLVVLPGEAHVDMFRGQLPQHRFVAREEVDRQSPLERSAVDDDATAYLLFTSGSTGIPKGVGVLHRNVRAFLDAVLPLYDIGPEDRISQTFDMTFDLSVFDMFVAWERGACLCCPANLRRPDRFIRESALTVWFSVPSLAIVMLRFGMLKPERYPTLRTSLFCGEPLPADVASAWSEAATHSIVENLYGPTELTIACTRYRWTADSPVDVHLGTVPIGVPLPGMEPLVVDESLRPVPEGEPGELLLTGPQMTPGYWQDPDKTAAAFVTPRGQIRRYYRTGDRVRLARRGGPLLYLGRVDHQIKVRGHRVELGEIEAVVREESGLQGVVAVGWPRTASGVAGVEVFVEAETAVAEDLVPRLAKRLPDYMVPRTIHVMDRLPLNANGKYDRKGLVSRLEAQG